MLTMNTCIHLCQMTSSVPYSSAVYTYCMTWILYLRLFLHMGQSNRDSGQSHATRRISVQVTHQTNLNTTWWVSWSHVSAPFLKYFFKMLRLNHCSSANTSPGWSFGVGAFKTGSSTQASTCVCVCVIVLKQIQLGYSVTVLTHMTHFWCFLSVSNNINNKSQRPD